MNIHIPTLINNVTFISEMEIFIKYDEEIFPTIHNILRNWKSLSIRVIQVLKRHFLHYGHLKHDSD